MSAAPPLDRLAEAHGIEPGYRDIWRRDIRIGVETKRALLAAMGVAADSDAEIEDSLKAALSKPFDRLLPDVRVFREGERLLLPVAVDAAISGRLAWTFVAEDGEETTGEARIDELDSLGQGKMRGRAMVHRALVLPIQPKPGYHRLTLTRDDGEQAEADIIVTPKRAFWPDDLDRPGGLVGLTAPLYGLRSTRNAGMGDFADLAGLAAVAAPLGASFIGINPVHALFPHLPGRISPYSPSSRSFLNVLMIALDRVPELDHAVEAQAMLIGSDASPALQQLRAAEHVDYAGVSAFKLGVLEMLYRAFSSLPSSSPRRAGFEAFRAAGGEALARQACFDALAEHMLDDDPSMTDWRRWPAVYRSPESPDVRVFANANPERVTFHTYLQWLADQQLGDAQRQALDAGMPLGLYLDLAVGVAPDGAEAWSDQDSFADAARIGAPPDDFNPNGQNWDLLPLSPEALRSRSYRPFIQLLRQAMRHAGLLRIDHVLGFARSFWLPTNREIPGAYVRYPMRDLLGLVSLESQRQRCAVVGEDLGTVPGNLREALSEHGLLGCRLLYFERDEVGARRPASTYPQACIASVGTHDLPTLKGYWQGHDIDLRESLGLYVDPAQPDEDRRVRRQDLAALVRLLADEGLLPEGIDPDRPPATLPSSLLEACHRFLGRTPAVLKVVQLEDAVGALDQANLPGTIEEYPNWQRKIEVPLEQLGKASGLGSLFALFGTESTATAAKQTETQSPQD